MKGELRHRCVKTTNAPARRKSQLLRLNVNCGFCLIGAEKKKDSSRCQTETHNFETEQNEKWNKAPKRDIMTTNTNGEHRRRTQSGRNMISSCRNTWNSCWISPFWTWYIQWKHLKKYIPFALLLATTHIFSRLAIDKATWLFKSVYL